MTIFTLRVPVALGGAALPCVVMPWANLSGAGVHSALSQNFSPAIVTTQADFVTPRGTTVMERPLAAMAAAELTIDVRKQYPHKTRVNVGGDGASGPYPEREPA